MVRRLCLREETEHADAHACERQCAGARVTRNVLGDAPPDGFRPPGDRDHGAITATGVSDLSAGAVVSLAPTNDGQIGNFGFS